jgi:hypothetical protein
MSATAATLEERLVRFSAGDGTELNLINVRGPKPPAKPPVLLVHGAGVRANIFRAPSGRTIVDELVDAGHDVWLENWRASIDIPHNRWTLDQAAVLDHPAAVRTVLAESGADEVSGDPAGLDQLHDVRLGPVPGDHDVSNAVALHPVVSRLARPRWTDLPPAKVWLPEPQWGVGGAVVLQGDHRLASSPPRVRQRVCKPPATPRRRQPTLWRHRPERRHA